MTSSTLENNNGSNIAASSNKLVLFTSADGEVAVEAAFNPCSQEVWLNRQQMAVLFDRDVKTIGKHVSNALKEELLDSANPTVAKFATVQTEGDRQVERQVEYYNLDVVISVGYRVKSKRGIEFRRWATDVLKRYIMDGVAENERRLKQISQVIAIAERLPNDVDAKQIINIVKSYAPALDLLDDYDHQRLSRPEGCDDTYVLDYDECISVINNMRFSNDSGIFGVEKDESFKSSIAAIYLSYDGTELYPSLEEKAANLLYFIVKNHSFHDGNKRIGACLFLYFLDKNQSLFINGRKVIGDETLVATTIMIAESKPGEKEAMVSLVMNFLSSPSENTKE